MYILHLVRLVNLASCISNPHYFNGLTGSSHLNPPMIHYCQQANILKKKLTHTVRSICSILPMSSPTAATAARTWALISKEQIPRLRRPPQKTNPLNPASCDASCSFFSSHLPTGPYSCVICLF